MWLEASRCCHEAVWPGWLLLLILLTACWATKLWMISLNMITLTHWALAHVTRFRCIVTITCSNVDQVILYHAQSLGHNEFIIILRLRISSTYLWCCYPPESYGGILVSLHPYLSEIWIKMKVFSYKKISLKMSSAKYLPFLHDLNVWMGVLHRKPSLLLTKVWWS